MTAQRLVSACSTALLAWCIVPVLCSTPHAQVPSLQLPSLPITMQGDLLFVPVSIDGKDAQFILDTGGGINVISQRLLGQVSHSAAGKFSGKTMRGESISLPMYRIPLLQVGPLRLQPAMVGAWDVLDKFKVEGIVSAKAFEKQPVEVDFRLRRLVFLTPESIPQLRRTGTVVRLRLRRQHRQSLDLFAKFRLSDSQIGECEIDTGSPGETINERYMPLLGIDQTNKDAVKREERTTMLGNPVVRYKATIASISLANSPAISLRNPQVVFQHAIYDCVVGTDFWQGHSIVLDLPKHEMIVDAK
jgi:hypothetical protein